MPNNAYNMYQKNSVFTASPGELTLMLYEGCIKFIKQAKIALVNGDYADKNIKLQKAQAIITELMVTLDEKQSISKDMMRLYDYIQRRIIQANIKNDTEILDEVEKLILDFRDAWKRVLEINKRNHSKSSPVRTRI
ncbi:flagellar export chaperone FliS [Sporolactobacillus shoreicorticis]|uniref:Flagellar secretion chaperone FliS n=1 Tax=Sporolactobacillus shoreicorticis TaxID=1923877 RepID=A0ABW5S068_9BACL|nr:flagellar export chaperone FliS [Sporolactobacillus shoreicorticis]MCO7125022.1 flagellar export chaperone FliS [Sporolactobacillus shoreicorticis]